VPEADLGGLRAEWPEILKTTGAAGNFLQASRLFDVNRGTICDHLNSSESCPMCNRNWR
jgi:hypothetical protein